MDLDKPQETILSRGFWFVVHWTKVSEKLKDAIACTQIILPIWITVIKLKCLFLIIYWTAPSWQSFGVNTHRDILKNIQFSGQCGIFWLYLLHCFFFWDVFWSLFKSCYSQNGNYFIKLILPRSRMNFHAQKSMKEKLC